MKKQNLALTILIAVLFCFSLFIFPISNSSVVTHAEETSTDITEVDSKNCKNLGIDDSLYKVLNRLAQHITNGDKGTISKFSVDVFNYNAHDESYYNPSTECGNDILNDLKDGILNLSTGSYSENAYSFIKRNPNSFSIKSIAGLGNLNLSNITTLILDGNSIPNVYESDLSGLYGLTTLYVRGNNLKTFVLSDDLTELNTLDLSGNQLKKIDISKLANSRAGVGPSVDISCNDIEDINNITFPNDAIKLSKLDISFNKLNNLTQEDINKINTYLSQGAKVNVLIQGATDFSKLYAGDSVTIFAGNEIEDFNVKIFYNNTSSLYDADSDNLICATIGQESVETIAMPAGKIKIQFYSGEDLITSGGFSHLSTAVLNEILKINSNGNYSIPIKATEYKGYVNGKEVSSLKQETDIKVVLSVKDLDNIPNKEDILFNAQYYYFRGSEQHTNSNTIEVKANGTYNYYIYTIFDGIESGRTRIQIIRQDYSGVTWGVIVIVIIFVVLAAGFFIYKWFRNGAQIAPLSEKEIFRMNKRKGTLTDTNNNDDYISSLDAPRHETRVSDNKYDEDDSLTNNLNDDNGFSEEIKPTNDFPEDIDK